MESHDRNVVVILTVGKADNGKHATLAFSCAFSALAMGHKASVFLTSDGAVWGYKGSAQGITVQGFPPLQDLINQYLDEGGRLILCSVCHRTCGMGSPDIQYAIEKLPQTEIGGFATILDLAADGVAITF
ncbi:MAG: DsrE family protein [Planctomycetaceae bacterium]|nr:DsrE family protein [Planctomycetaceae bacterium]